MRKSGVKFMSEHLKIKQFMQIPDSYTLLSISEDINGDSNLWEPLAEGWTYLQVLVDGRSEEDDYITFYGIDPAGVGGIDEDAKLIKKEYCPICNKEMKIHFLEEMSNESLWYECLCGHIKTFNQEGN